MENFNNVDLKFALKEIQDIYYREAEIANTFVEILKDEINSTHEKETYNNVKELILKYQDNNQALKIIDEVISSITGGASMTEVLLVARDEVVAPIRIDNMINDNTCDKNTTFE